MARKKMGSSTLPEVTVSDDGDVRHLHLGTPWVQGSMRVDDPWYLELEYIQRMMAWLLLIDPTTIADRHAVQLGLGAGALTKHCHHVLRMRTTAIEINPQVISVCRSWFHVPHDSPRMQVLLADAGITIAQPQWHKQVDVLHVDLYDHEAAAPVLDSPDFYANCHNALTHDGAMLVNLFGRSSSFARSVDSMQAAFGRHALWAFKPTREGNTVVLAQRTPSRPTRDVLTERAAAIESLWGLPASKWVKGFKPLEAVLPAGAKLT